VIKNYSLYRHIPEYILERKLEVADEILSLDFVIYNPVIPENLRKGHEVTKNMHLKQ